MNHVVGVLDADAPGADAVEALTSGGFLDSEIHVACGSEQADMLKASTGRRGLASVAITAHLINFLGRFTIEGTDSA